MHTKRQQQHLLDSPQYVDTDDREFVKVVPTTRASHTHRRAHGTQCPITILHSTTGHAKHHDTTPTVGQHGPNVHRLGSQRKACRCTEQLLHGVGRIDAALTYQTWHDKLPTQLSISLFKTSGKASRSLLILLQHVPVHRVQEWMPCSLKSLFLRNLPLI